MERLLEAKRSDQGHLLARQDWLALGSNPLRVVTDRRIVMEARIARIALTTSRFRFGLNAAARDPAYRHCCCHETSATSTARKARGLTSAPGPA
jgi:hypothetical protein